MNLDGIMRSKYTSLACAMINAYFAISCATSGSWLLFIVCGVFCAYCFRNFLEARY
jgi:hypothetical protein